MASVMVFVDGLNVYHALDGVSRYRKYKWLDYMALASRYVIGSDALSGVLWFTAFYRWKPDKVQRHGRLVKVQEANGVEVIQGQFRMRHKTCKACGDRIPLPEEKRTDVNIAVQLLQRAYRDEYDKAIIITGDSDMVPAIHAVKESFPSKKVGIIPPIGRKAEEIEKAAHFKNQMTENDLRESMLPDPVILPDGRSLTCPPEWK